VACAEFGLTRSEFERVRTFVGVEELAPEREEYAPSRQEIAQAIESLLRTRDGKEWLQELLRRTMPEEERCPPGCRLPHMIAMGMLDGAGTQTEIVKRIDDLRLGDFAYVLGYTADRKEMFEAILRAHQRGVRMFCVFDLQQSVGGGTSDQRARLLYLVHNGMENSVRLVGGYPLQGEYAAVGRVWNGSGRMHAKACLCGNFLIFGSTNWTTSSRGNREVGGLFYLKPGASSMERAEIRRPFVEAWEEGVPFNQAAAGQAQSRCC
jgi:hypothetical protein